MIITVDGLSASGKGTLSKKLAVAYDLPCLDTGALWRVLALLIAREGFTADNASDRLAWACHELLNAGLDDALTTSDEIRTEPIGNLASVISCFPQVRERIDHFIADWSRREGGGVLDGRDVGVNTVPHADHKFFLVAPAGIRAARRGDQLGASMIERADILRGIWARDKREIYRQAGASRPAIDAVVIDTSGKAPDDVLKIAMDVIESRVVWEHIYQTAGAL